MARVARSLRTGLAVATAIMAIAPPIGATATSGRRLPPVNPETRFDLPPDDCLEAYPAAIDVKGVTDDNRTVKLDVMVAIDVAEGASIANLLADADPQVRAEGQARFDALAQKVHALLDAAITTYAPLGIELRLHYDLLMPLVDGEPRERTTDIDQEILIAKQYYGGHVPAGMDAVYAASDIDMSGTVAGKADCIGGVRDDDSAFAAGEIDLAEVPLSILGVTMFQDQSAKIMAHEVGHLLGAHHHYANCAEGIPTETVPDALSVCTLMINDIGLASLNFSTLNGTIVRGHAVDFASANDGS
jgi:reprolysin-like metallo-peptidase family M12B